MQAINLIWPTSVWNESKKEHRTPPPPAFVCINHPIHSWLKSIIHSGGLYARSLTPSRGIAGVAQRAEAAAVSLLPDWHYSRAPIALSAQDAQNKRLLISSHAVSWLWYLCQTQYIVLQCFNLRSVRYLGTKAFICGYVLIVGMCSFKNLPTLYI